MTPLGRVLSAPVPFTLGALALKVAPYTLAVTEAFETYLVGLAYANLRKNSPALGPEYADERAALRRDVDAGEYDFGGEVSRKALRFDKHLKHLAYLCLCAGHADDPKTPITPALVDQIWADDATARAFVEAMYEANRDPNEVAPGKPGPAAGPA